MRFKNISLLLFICFIWANCAGQQLINEPTSNLNYIVKEAGENRNLVILIHGYGSNEKDLFSFANRFPKTTVVCVRGPITRDSNSFSWYDIELKPDGNHGRNLPQALQSEAMLLQFIKAIETKYKSAKTIVGGFSQGAIMSAQIALNHPESVDGIICISGMLLSSDTKGTALTKEKYKTVIAFCGHGVKDQVISIEKGRKCSAALKKSGNKVTHKEYPITHQISGQELKDIESWYRTNFPAKG